MNRRSYQKGGLYEKNGGWFGCWREFGKQRARKLADVCDRYPDEKSVRPLLDEILRGVNSGRISNPDSVLTVAEFVERHFLPHCESELKPSTAHGYRQDWRMYLAARMRKVSLRDCTCATVTQVLAAIHREGGRTKRGLGRKTLKHCKALISAVFTYAKRIGAYDGVNPAQDAGIPRQARASTPIHAVSPDELMAMLRVLEGQARIAVALTYFAALRNGEARGMRWSDLDGKKLHVRRSVWKTIVQTPKTESSIAPVAVCETLRGILAEARNGLGDGYILWTPSGKPIDLHNLASRVVRPTLKAAGLKWYGWRALRTGAATLAASLDSALAAKGFLRHANVATTTAHYVKDVPQDVQRLTQKIDALFAESGKGERVQ